MSTVETLFCPKCEWRWAPPPVVGFLGDVDDEKKGTSGT